MLSASEILTTTDIDWKKRYYAFSFSFPKDKYVKLLTKYTGLFKGQFFSIGQEEESEYGYNHMQCFVQTINGSTCAAFKTKFDVKYVVPVNPEHYELVIKYCDKEDTRVEGGLRFQFGTQKQVDKAMASVGGPSTSTTKLEFYGRLLHAEKDELEDILKEERPDLYITQYSAILSANERFNGVTTDRANFTEFNIAKINVHDGKSHIFHGLSGVGKTEFALSHFKTPVLISNQQDFNRVNSSTDGIVIDDINFNNFNCCNLIHFLDVALNRTVNVKYGKAVIRKGLPRIFTFNTLQNFWPDKMYDEQRPAIERRCVFHEFNSSLFGKPTCTGRGYRKEATKRKGKNIVPTTFSSSNFVDIRGTIHSTAKARDTANSLIEPKTGYVSTIPRRMGHIREPSPMCGSPKIKFRNVARDNEHPVFEEIANLPDGEPPILYDLDDIELCSDNEGPTICN